MDRLFETLLIKMVTRMSRANITSLAIATAFALPGWAIAQEPAAALPNISTADITFEPATPGRLVSLVQEASAPATEQEKTQSNGDATQASLERCGRKAAPKIQKTLQKSLSPR